MQMYVYPLRSGEGMGVSGASAIGSCQPADVGAGNKPHVFCQSSKHISLLRYFFIPLIEDF